jgi:hypothetical protein
MLSCNTVSVSVEYVVVEKNPERETETIIHSNSSLVALLVVFLGLFVTPKEEESDAFTFSCLSILMMMEVRSSLFPPP